jgi:soluble lytic murein transglycosylase-like protein
MRSWRAVRARAKKMLRRMSLVAGAIGLLVVISINGAVWFVSGSGPFPLDPRHLSGRLRALRAYALHRPGCLLFKDADVVATARRAARKHRIEAELFEALVEVESGSVAHRISRAGACGPAQLMPSTARDLGVKDPFDPASALDGGARYLREQLKRFRGRRDLALAAYNAGPGAVHGAVPRNGETEYYVPRVLAVYARKQAERRELERRAER